MIRLALKKSFNQWVDMGDGVKFRLDYPNMEQEQKLQDILLRQKDNYLKSAIDYERHYIKCAIKDWQGVIDEEGKEIECSLRHGELEDNLWWELVKDIEQTKAIYTKIESELSFKETDKKKSESAVTSGVKEN